MGEYFCQKPTTTSSGITEEIDDGTIPSIKLSKSTMGGITSWSIAIVGMAGKIYTQASEVRKILPYKTNLPFK